MSKGSCAQIARHAVKACKLLLFFILFGVTTAFAQNEFTLLFMTEADASKLPLQNYNHWDDPNTEWRSGTPQFWVDLGKNGNNYSVGLLGATYIKNGNLFKPVNNTYHNTVKVSFLPFLLMNAHQQAACESARPMWIRVQKNVPTSVIYEVLKSWHMNDTGSNTLQTRQLVIILPEGKSADAFVHQLGSLHRSGHVEISYEVDKGAAFDDAVKSEMSVMMERSRAMPRIGLNSDERRSGPSTLEVRGEDIIRNAVRVVF